MNIVPPTLAPPEPSKWNHLENKENQLWRVSLWFLTLLATGLAVLSWERLKELPFNLAGIPAGVLILAAMFAFYTWKQRAEIGELRGFLRGMQDRAEAPPSEAQLRKLFDIVAGSQHGYRELIDSFDDVVFSVGLDGRILTCNRRCADLLEQPFQRMVLHTVEEIIAEPAWTDIQAVLPRFLDRRHWQGIVKVRLRPNGRVMYFDVNLQAIVSGGQVTGISGMARDVTREREMEAFYTELFARLEEGVYLRTPDGRLLDANPAMVSLLGYNSKEELLGVNWHDLETAETSVALRSGETALRRKDGAVGVFHGSAVPILDNNGQVTRVQGTLNDVTREREMEDRWEQQREFVQRLVDSCPDTITALDAHGRFTFVSPRISDLLGFGPEELENRPFSEWILPEDVPAAQKLFTGLVGEQLGFATVEVRGHHRDGSLQIARINASPLRDRAGNVSGVVASIRGITELKKLEQQALQAEKLAAMGRLIAGVAHELNNPLTVILGAADLGASRALDDGVRHSFTLIEQQARRSARIVQDLVAFSRPPLMERSRVDLQQVIERTLKLQQHSLPQNRIHVDFEAVPGLPAVSGDANQIMQVLLNLIMNAEQGIAAVRDSGTIRIRAGAGDGRVWVTVQDDGAGIPPEAAPYLFDPFFTTKAPGKGTGLGLSVSLALVREHGGTLTAENAAGGGALFTLTLQAASGDPPAAPPAPKQADLKYRSVLVVDDEQGILDLVRSALTLRGMRVDCAANGQEAVSMLAKRPYDCVLCDWKMPGMTAHQVFDHLPQPDSAARRFIVMSGDLMQPETQAFLNLTRVAVLRKPFTLAELTSMVGQELERESVSHRGTENTEEEPLQ